MRFLSFVTRRIFHRPSPVQEFLLAVGRGDLDAVRGALDAHPDAIGWKSLNGYEETPLMWAARAGRREMCELLLARGADIEARDNVGRSVFRHLVDGMIRGAAELHPDPSNKFDPSDHEATALLLLSRGADINTRAGGGETAISRTLGGFTEAASFLLDHGADVDAANDCGNTALMLAAAGGSEKMVMLLLGRGASALLKNSKSETARDIAAGRDAASPGSHAGIVARLAEAEAEQRRAAPAPSPSVRTDRPILVLPPLRLTPKSRK